MLEPVEYRIKLLAGSGRRWVPCPFGLFNEGEPRRRLLASCERAFRVVGFFVQNPASNAWILFFGLVGQQSLISKPVHATFAEGLLKLDREFIVCEPGETLQVDLEGDLRSAAIVVSYEP